MSHDVFICYSSRDKPVADAVCAVLEAEGVRCWVAPRDILPGADWGESIIDSINEARAMVLIFSSNANTAQSQIKREVERAVNKGIPVIPFRIENVMPTKALEYFLSTPHWLDAFTPPLDEHVRQLAVSIMRLLGKQVVPRPLLFATPPTMPPLPQSLKTNKIDLKDIRIGGKPIHEWAKQPKNAAILAVLAVILGGVLWYVFRPTATPDDQQAWNVAAMGDSIPAYQLYMREEPDGYFRGRAQDRVNELKTEVDQAFARAKQANTLQAYASFMQSYAKDGIDMTEAQEGYANANAQEGNIRDAYRRAISSRSREAYQAFLVSYGNSSYAADVRQRLASCHSEMRNNGNMQSSQLQESAIATASDANTACSQARANATNLATQACTAERGQPGSVRVLNQRMGNSFSSTNMARTAGQFFGNSLFAGNRGNVYNTPTQYQCSAQIAESCSRMTNSAHAVDICE
jgi:TIR domain